MSFIAKASAPLVRATSAKAASLRAFSSTAGANKDFVQELYLRELKAYKAPQKAADAHVGQVREFATPSAPKAPAVPSSSDLASQLDAYAASEPDHAAPAPTSSGESVTDREDVNAFLANAAADFKVEAHH